MELVNNIKEMLDILQCQNQAIDLSLQRLIKELVNNAENMKREILLLLGELTVVVQSQTEASFVEVNTISTVSNRIINSAFSDCRCSIL